MCNWPRDAPTSLSSREISQQLQATDPGGIPELGLQGHFEPKIRPLNQRWSKGADFPCGISIPQGETGDFLFFSPLLFNVVSNFRPRGSTVFKQNAPTHDTGAFGHLWKPTGPMKASLLSSLEAADYSRTHRDLLVSQKLVPKPN